jgi:hypothetical protein
MKSFYCQQCGKRNFTNQRKDILHCHSCKNNICHECEIENDCIDCFVKFRQKDFIVDMIPKILYHVKKIKRHSYEA